MFEHGVVRGRSLLVQAHGECLGVLIWSEIDCALEQPFHEVFFVGGELAELVGFRQVFYRHVARRLFAQCLELVDLAALLLEGLQKCAIFSARGR